MGYIGYSSTTLMMMKLGWNETVWKEAAKLRHGPIKEEVK